MRTQDSYLIALMGSGIAPSLTPPMHEREADRLGLRYTYRRLDLDVLGRTADDTAELLNATRLAGFDGLNITHPCKQEVIEHLDELSVEAETLNAVNTVVFDGAKAIGHNTDWSGFAASFRRGLADVKLSNVVQLGAGGAGAAVAYALLKLGTQHLRVLDLDAARAEQLATTLRNEFGRTRISAGDAEPPALRAELHGSDGLVHATPTGMATHPGSPLPTELLHPKMWVAEVVYRPLETELVATARQRGCRVLHGGGMAVFQAVDAFRLFTGTEPDRGRMLRHFAELEGVDLDADQ